MDSDTQSARPTPKAFISYSWDSDDHKRWALEFASRLRSDGVETTIDQWALAHGDQLPKFMETAVRDNDYVLIVCTPRYAHRSNNRIGGTGYEGDIMTAEVWSTRNERKFIPVLRSGDWLSASPTWLSGKWGVDLSGDPFSEEQYLDLVNTLHGTRPIAPPVVPRRRHASAPAPPQTVASPDNPPMLEPIRILNIVVDEVTSPRNDGTRGSALYRVPFQLSRRPSSEWAESFVLQWNRPPSWTSMHRPGIASVRGDKVILDGTTIEEVEKTHRKTLLLVLEATNRAVAEYEKAVFEHRRKQESERQEHQRNVSDAADRIKFDPEDNR